MLYRVNGELKSFTGFCKYLDVLDGLGLSLDWNIIGTFSLVGILGSFAGKAVSTKLPQHVLKRSFAVFLFIIGALIVVQGWPDLIGASASSAPAN